ncbi:MAG: hypothetical protein AB3N14_05390 [Flavobacteriaceae bacterium]
MTRNNFSHELPEGQRYSDYLVKFKRAKTTNTLKTMHNGAQRKIKELDLDEQIKQLIRVDCYHAFIDRKDELEQVSSLKFPTLQTKKGSSQPNNPAALLGAMLRELDTKSA